MCLGSRDRTQVKIIVLFQVQSASTGFWMENPCLYFLLGISLRLVLALKYEGKTSTRDSRVYKRLIQVQVLSCLIVPTEYWNEVCHSQTLSTGIVNQCYASDDEGRTIIFLNALNILFSQLLPKNSRYRHRETVDAFGNGRCIVNIECLDDFKTSIQLSEHIGHQ